MPISFPQYNEIFPPFYANVNSFDTNSINNSQSLFNNSNVFNNNIISINNQNEQISNIIKRRGKKIRKKFNKKYKDKRPSDWICNRCGNLNYSFRAICNICKLPSKDNPYYKSNI